MTRSAPRNSTRGRLVLVGLPALICLPALLAACTMPGAPPPGSPEAQEQQGLVSACEQRANEAYDLTHRGDIYAAAPGTNTPYSANYQPGIVSPDVFGRYEHDRMVSDCIRNTGAEGTRAPQLQPMTLPPGQAPTAEAPTGEAPAGQAPPGQIPSGQR